MNFIDPKDAAGQGTASTTAHCEGFKRELKKAREIGDADLVATIKEQMLNIGCEDDGIDAALRQRLEEAKERFQAEQVRLRAEEMNEVERNQRAQAINNAERAFWESLGPEAQQLVHERIQELRPQVVPVHPRQLGSTAPVPSDAGVLDEYYFLHRLAERE